MKENKNSVLVSIIVISFNSAKYIIETLESIKLQSYECLELIISDDGSTDKTVEVCEKWIKENKKRFENIKLLTVEKNTGTAANCNRGVKASSGEWIKLTAADDLLKDDCIQINIDHITSNQSIKILMSDVECFFDDEGQNAINSISKPVWFFSNITTPKEQYKSLLIKYCGNTAAFFIARSVYNDFFYDEYFPFIEDYSFALTATKINYFIHYLPVSTVKYRMRNDSVFFGNTKNNTIFGNFYKKRRKFDQVYRHPYLPKIRKNYEIFQYYRLYTLDFLKLNKNTKLNKAIYKFSGYLNPFKYLLVFLK
jgi:alpha-1,3-rhamnosyltransferase